MPLSVSEQTNTRNAKDAFNEMVAADPRTESQDFLDSLNIYFGRDVSGQDTVVGAGGTLPNPLFKSGKDTYRIERDPSSNDDKQTYKLQKLNPKVNSVSLELGSFTVDSGKIVFTPDPQQITADHKEITNAIEAVGSNLEQLDRERQQVIIEQRAEELQRAEEEAMRQQQELARTKAAAEAGLPPPGGGLNLEGRPGLREESGTDDGLGGKSPARRRLTKRRSSDTNRSTGGTLELEGGDLEESTDDGDLAGNPSIKKEFARFPSGLDAALQNAKDKEGREKLERAAITVQTAFRSSRDAGQEPSPKPRGGSLLTDDGAATLLQAAWRGYKGRKKADERRKEKDHFENLRNELKEFPGQEDTTTAARILNRSERDAIIREFGDESLVDYNKHGLLNFCGSGFNNGKTKFQHDHIEMDESGIFTTYFDRERGSHYLDLHQASMSASNSFLQNNAKSSSEIDFQFIKYRNEELDFSSEINDKARADNLGPKTATRVSQEELIFVDPNTGQLKKITGTDEVQKIRSEIEEALTESNSLNSEQQNLLDQALDFIRAQSKEGEETPTPEGVDITQINQIKFILGIKDGEEQSDLSELIDSALANKDTEERIRREIKYGNSDNQSLKDKIAGKTGDEREKLISSFEKHNNREASREVMYGIAKAQDRQLADSRAQLKTFQDYFKKTSSTPDTGVFNNIDSFPITTGTGISTSVNPSPEYGKKFKTAKTGRISFNYQGDKAQEFQEHFMEIPGTGLFARVSYIPAGETSSYYKNGKRIDIPVSDKPQIKIDENTIWQKSFVRNTAGVVQPITVPYKVNSTSFSLSKPGPASKLEQKFFDPDFIQRRFNSFAIESVLQIDNEIQCATFKGPNKADAISVDMSVASSAVVKNTDEEIARRIRAKRNGTLSETEQEKLAADIKTREDALDNYVKQGLKSRTLSNQLIERIGGEPMPDVWKKSWVGTNKDPNNAVEQIAAKTFGNVALDALGEEAVTNEFLRRVTQFAAEVAQDDFFASSKETAISKSINKACSALVDKGTITSEEQLTQYKEKLLDQIGGYSDAKSNKQFRKSNWWGALHAITGGLTYAAAKAHDATEHSGYQNTSEAVERLQGKGHDSGADFQAHMKIHDRNILALLIKNQEEQGQGGKGLSDDELRQLRQEINARETTLENLSKTGNDTTKQSNILLTTLTSGRSGFAEVSPKGMTPQALVGEIAKDTFSNEKLGQLSKMSGQDLVQNQFLRRVAESAANIVGDSAISSQRGSKITEYIDAAVKELIARGQISTGAEVQSVTTTLTSNIKDYAEGRELNNTKAAAEKVDSSLRFSEMGQKSKAAQNRDMATAEVMAIKILSEVKSASKLTKEQKGLLESLPADAITTVIKGFNAKIETIRASGHDPASAAIYANTPNVGDSYNPDYDPQQPEAVKPDRENSSWRKGSYLNLGAKGGFTEKVDELAKSIFGIGADGNINPPNANPNTQSTLELLQLCQFNFMAVDFTLDCAQEFKTHENARSSQDGIKRDNREAFLARAQDVVEAKTKQQTFTGKDPFKDALLKAAKDRAIKPSRGNQKMTKTAMDLSNSQGETRNRKDRKGFREGVMKEQAERPKPTAQSWVTKIKEKEAAAQGQGVAASAA